MKALWRRDVSETSLTASDLGTPGEVRYETNGNVYKLMQASVTLSHGAAVMWAIATNAEPYQVNVATNLGVRCNGVYGVGQSVSLASNAFFWGQVKGTGPVLVGGATATSNLNLLASTIGAVSIVESVASTLGRGAFAFRTIGTCAATVTANMHIDCAG